VADQADGQQTWPLLFVFEQPEGLQMEPQACLNGLHRVGLNLRFKPCKRLSLEKQVDVTLPLEINQVWSMDFLHNQLEDGRAFRLVNLIDGYNREAFGHGGETSRCQQSGLSGSLSIRILGAESLKLFVVTTVRNTSML
jgi:hypothetical protein